MSNAISEYLYKKITSTTGNISGAVSDYLAAHPPTVQGLTNKVDKVLGKSLVADTEITKIHSLHADDQDLSGKSDVGHTHSYEPANNNIQTHIGSTHAPSTAVTLTTVKADVDIASTISLKHSNSLDHSNASDHTNVFKTGITTRDITTASGTVNIAHGLGRAPVCVRVTAYLVQTANTTECIGVSSGSQHSGLCTIYTEGTTTATTDTTYSSTSFELGFSTATIVNPYTGANRQTCTITFDATNIIFTWIKTGTVVSAVANILWEAF